MDAVLYKEMLALEKTYWWHVAKRRLVQKAMSLNGNLSKHMKVLDSGCGAGAMVRELSQHTSSVFGADGSKLALEFCRRQGLKNIMLVDFEKRLPHRREYFDAVVCLDVLEHINDDRGLLKEFAYILKDGGKLYLTVPAYQFLWSYWDDTVGHKRRYRKNSLIELMESVGLKALSSTYFYSFLLPVIIVFRLVKALIKNKNTDYVSVPQPINDFLLAFCAIERKIIEMVSIPFGMSIFIVAERKRSYESLPLGATASTAKSQSGKTTC